VYPLGDFRVFDLEELPAKCVNPGFHRVGGGLADEDRHKFSEEQVAYHVNARAFIEPFEQRAGRVQKRGKSRGAAGAVGLGWGWPRRQVPSRLTGRLDDERHCIIQHVYIWDGSEQSVNVLKIPCSTTGGGPLPEANEDRANCEFRCRQRDSLGLLWGQSP
jgi:hypothetical protein